MLNKTTTETKETKEMLNKTTTETKETNKTHV